MLLLLGQHGTGPNPAREARASHEAPTGGTRGSGDAREPCSVQQSERATLRRVIIGGDWPCPPGQGVEEVNLAGSCSLSEQAPRASVGCEGADAATGGPCRGPFWVRAMAASGDSAQVKVRGPECLGVDDPLLLLLLLITTTYYYYY